MKVLSRLTIEGNERVIDAGCGTGRLTAGLLARLPRGRLVAIDRSWNMLLTARAHLRPDFGARVLFARVDCPLMPFDAWADLVFSTATFHWVHYYEGALLARASSAPARRSAVCAVRRGPEPRARSRTGRASDEIVPVCPVVYRLGCGVGVRDRGHHRRTSSPAGFIYVQTSLEEAATTLPDEASYRESRRQSCTIRISRELPMRPCARASSTRSRTSQPARSPVYARRQPAEPRRP